VLAAGTLGLSPQERFERHEATAALFREIHGLAEIR
jgi:hypothetical protein